MESAEVDEDINEGVEIGNRLVIAEFGTFDTQSFGLRIDTLSDRAIIVNRFEGIGVAVELVTEASANGGGHGGETTPFRPLLVVDRARLTGGNRMKERAGIPTSLVFDQSGFATVGGFKRHGQTSTTQGQAIRIKRALGVTASFDKGNGSKAASLMEIFIDIKGIKGGVQGPIGGFMPQTALGLGQ